MVKCLPEFKYFFTVFLKNRNFISKIRISKVTDYAALNKHKMYCATFALIKAQIEKKDTFAKAVFLRIELFQVLLDSLNNAYQSAASII